MTAKGTYVPMTPAQRWGNALRAAMTARGYTNARLVEEAGINRTTLQHWRRGTSVPMYTSALRMAEILMWDALVDIAQEALQRTCRFEGCDRTFIDMTRTQVKAYCSRAHAQAARRRQARELDAIGTYADSKLKTETIKRYVRTIDAFCRACGIDACPDATCVIQVEGLSPLPLADERLRVIA